jgi:hypothetical protein
MAQEGSAPATFRASLGLGAAYNSGLTAVATDDQGNTLDQDTFGGSVTWSLSGSKHDRRNGFFGSYSGSYDGYGAYGYYSGLSQHLNLTFRRQMSRRWGLFLAQAASNSNTIFNSTTRLGTDEFTADLPSPAQEILDVRSYYFSSAAGLNYQRTARLSFSLSGGTLITRRHSRALASSDGYLGTANISYRLSRRQEIGISYIYATFFLTRQFGETSVQSANLTFGRVLSPHWFINVGAGPNYVEYSRLSRVIVDPVIARLTGQSSTIAAVDGRRRGFNALGGISGRYRNTRVQFGYLRAITPGNGLYFTSEQESVSAGLGYSTRRFSFTGSASWNRLKAITQDLGNAQGYGGGLGASYRLARKVHFVSSANYLFWNIEPSTFRRERFYARVGVTLSSGDLPLALW